MAFRFVHTADIHLDSPLKSLALRDPALAETVATATRTAFTNIIDLCLAEAVDALLIAGDLYDGANASMKTAAFLAAELRRLPPETHVFILKGNHDALSTLTARLDLPDIVKTFDGRGRFYEIASQAGDAVAVHGVSFADPHAPQSLLPKYKPPRPDAINVGLMHTSLDGAEGHDPYAPTRAADLMARGYAYWALGHIHKRQVIQDAGSTIVMPGIPQGRHVNEDGPKSVTLATVAADGETRLEERSVAAAEFRRVPVDLDTDVANMDAALAATEAAVDRALAESRAEMQIVRLAVAPAPAFAWRFRREFELFEERAKLSARTRGAWIESIEIAAPRPPEAAATDWPDLAAELRAVVDDPAFRLAREEIAGDIERFLKNDPDLLYMLGHDQAAEAATHERLAADAVEAAIARLAASAQDAAD